MAQQYSFTLDYSDVLHTEEDLRLSLLAGADVKLGNLVIEPYTLQEIIQIGYSTYQKKIRQLMLEPADFELEKTKPEMVSILQQNNVYTAFDLMYRFLGAEFRQLLIDGLKIVFKTDDIRAYEQKDFISIGDIDPDNLENAKIINRDNFEKIIRVVKLQNYLEMDFGQAVQDEANPADEKTRELLEFQKKMREKLKKIKNSSKDNEGATDFDFSSIVSAITTKSMHINKLNVWGMTLYQVYDEYNRLTMIDDYDTNIKAILAGAKDVNITHWSALPESEN